MKFEPLSSKNIEKAIKLVHSVFPEDALSPDGPATAYRASLDPLQYKDFYAKYHLKKLEYFIASEDGETEIAGVTGFYTRTIGPADMIWLGWYCIGSSYRGKGLGRKILEWTVGEAKRKGFKTMRLYTSTDPNESDAQKLYEKMGFILIDKDDIEVASTHKILYREKKL